MGNDAIVYDIKDSKLDGGEGIDFVLANDSDLTMDKLLNGWGGSQDSPRAQNVEVLLKVQQVPQMVTHGHGCYSASFVGCNSILPPLHPMPPFLPNPFDLLRGMQKSNSQTETKGKTLKTNVDVETLLTGIISVWKDHVLQSSSVTECLASAHNDTEHQLVREFIESLHEELGVDSDVLWAIFMQWALERNGNSIDRHSKRLLNATLSGVDTSAIKTVQERCDVWMKA